MGDLEEEVVEASELEEVAVAGSEVAEEEVDEGSKTMAHLLRS